MRWPSLLFLFGSDTWQCLFLTLSSQRGTATLSCVEQFHLRLWVLRDRSLDDGLSLRQKNSMPFGKLHHWPKVQSHSLTLSIYSQ